MTKRLLVGLLALFTIPVPGRGDEKPLYNDQPVRFWIKALHSREDAARANGARVLGQLGPAARAAVGDLIVAVDDKHIEVRVAAIDALGQIGPDAEPAAAKLASLLNQGFRWYDIDLARRAAVALSKIQPNGVGPLVAALVNSTNFAFINRSVMDVSRLERFNDLLKDQRSELKLLAAVRGAGQLCLQSYWDDKGDKVAEAIDLQLKKIQEGGKKIEDDGKAILEKSLLDAAITDTGKAIKIYRDQVRLRPDSLKEWLGPDREQWRKTIKLLAESPDGLRVLAIVVAEFPESAITGMILKEW